MENDLVPFDPAFVVDELTRVGAVSILMIPDALRMLLWAEALECPFTVAERYAGPNRVEQNLSASTVIPPDGALMRFSRDLETHLTRTFESLREFPFETPLAFNEQVLQCYAPTAIGVGPHRDFSSDANLIAIAMLHGYGEFCLCDNRAGDHPRSLPSTPGHVILMRAPGFRYATKRPWHFARNITTDRGILTNRQVPAVP